MYKLYFSHLGSEYVFDCINGKVLKSENEIAERDYIECLKNTKSKIYNFINEPHLYLKILTTYNCNCNCIYCYEKNEHTNHVHLSSVMGSNEINIIKNFIIKYVNENSIKEVSLSWYGGEPLLNIKPILAINNLIKKIKHIKFNSEITTNGTLLNEDLCFSLKDSGISSASITIDGLKESHNIARPINNSNIDAFSEIMKNISIARKFLHINVVCVLRKSNANEIFDLIDYISKFDNISLFIGRVENISNCLKNSDDVLDYHEFAKIRMKAYIYALKKNIIVWPDAVAGLSGLCYAISIHGYTITPDCKIFKCIDTITDERYQIGYINNNSEIIITNIAQWDQIALKDDCNHCNLYPICVGGCAYEFIENNKRCCPIENSNGQPIDLNHFKNILIASGLSNKLFDNIRINRN
jgi:uncharacterized protein